MAWNLLDNLTSTNPQQNLVDLANVGNNNINNFWALLIILPLFVILTFRNFFKQTERKTVGLIWSSMATASFVCMLVATVMNLVGILSLTILSWIVGIGLLLVAIFIIIDNKK